MPMSIRAVQLGAAGAVLDGYVRDTDGILDLNFPTFSYESYAQDQGPRGKVLEFGVPIEMHGVKINPGDWVFGDRAFLRRLRKRLLEWLLKKLKEKSWFKKLS